MTGDLSPYEQLILTNVREHGCHITHVFDDEGDEPPFAYSAGFPQSLQQPEIIIFGLSQDIMHFMINEIYRQCGDGLVLEDGAELADLLEGHSCFARLIPSHAIEEEYFNSAIWLERRCSGRKMTSAFQIVWPSASNGLFPWDEGCDEEVRDLQPALYATSLNS